MPMPSLVRRVMPAPFTSAALLVLWLLLSRSTHVGQVLLGLVLGLGIPHLSPRLQLTNVRMRRPLVALRYILLVMADVLTSGFKVMRGVVTWRWRRPEARFVVIPLELRSPVGLAVLSMVTTVVPGTVWSELALDRGSLLLHGWDVPDEARFIAWYKARYERPLREIFE